MSNDRYAPWRSTTDGGSTQATTGKPAATEDDKFDRYAPFVPPVSTKEEEVKTPLESEPLDPVTKRLLEAASVGAGAATGAGLKYRTGMFGPEEGSKFMISRPGMGLEPLTQFQLGTKPGQVTEEARRTLQDLLAKFEGAQAVHSQEAVALREALERAISQLPEASMERNIALRRLAELGGIKAPAVAPLSAPSAASPDLVTQTLSGQTSPTQQVSPLAKAFGQHEFEHYMKLAREAGAKTLDDLYKLGITDKAYAQKMIDAGLHLPSPGGQVMVRPTVLMGIDNQPLASPEDLAAKQAAAEAEAAAALARRKAEIIRAQEVEQARSGYRTAGRTAAKLEDTIPMLTEKYAAHMGTQSPAATKLQPNISLAEEALLAARGQMPSKVGYATHAVRRALPVAGGVLAGAGAGEFGYDAYTRSREGDPIGAAISGLGAASSLASLIPTPATMLAGGVGALTSAGLLALYDKYGPSILPILEKKGVIPRGWNPANYSVMDKQSP